MTRDSVSGRIGILDTPADKDSIGIENYVKALSTFVLKCQTPMTIAVQGGWGTGKTSVMNMVGAAIANESHAHVVRFNTWQYSQFDLGDQLSTNLILRIIAELPDRPDNQDVKIRLFKIAQGLARASARVAAPIAGQLVNTILPGSGDSLRELASMVAEREQKFDLSPVEAIEKLRDDFESLVRESGKRVIVFIDDLDRLEPAKAVELMEAIKLFLDVPNCVFVLAIDFDVVKRGVGQKYGDDLSERKARSFFEKIIQVPFQLPVHSYQTEALVISGLQSHVQSGERIDDYVRLAKISVGTNPRATKRLINTFGLLRELAVVPGMNQVDMFALLCLQSAFPTVSGFLNVLDDVEDFLPSGGDENEDGGSHAQAPLNDAAETDAEVSEWEREWNRAVPYLRVVRDHFSNGTGDKPEFDRLRFSAATELASVTGSGIERTTVARGAWDLTTDEEIMRKRLGEHPEAVVDWGFEFRAALGAAALSVGQQGSAWTLQRTDVSVRKRVACLYFQKRNMVVVVERLPGEQTDVVRQLQDRIADSRVRVEAFGPADRPVVRMRWKPAELPDPSSVAAALLSVGVFGEYGGAASPSSE